MNPEHVSAGLEAIGRMIQEDAQKGDPNAAEASPHFQALLQWLAKKVNGPAPEMPRGAEQEEGGEFGVPREVPQGAAAFGPQMKGPKRRPMAGMSRDSAVMV